DWWRGVSRDGPWSGRTCPRSGDDRSRGSRLFLRISKTALLHCSERLALVLRVQRSFRERISSARHLVARQGYELHRSPLAGLEANRWPSWNVQPHSIRFSPVE